MKLLSKKSVLVVALGLSALVSASCGNVAVPRTGPGAPPVHPNVSGLTQTLPATLACFSSPFAHGTSQLDGALVGKSLAAAKLSASGPDQTWRVVAQNGTCDAITSDLEQGRIDLWIVNGRVVKAVREELSGTTSMS
jgi:hypothetical protein